MSNNSGYSLGVIPSGNNVRIVDLACGACSTCLAGYSLWCETPDQEHAKLVAETRSNVAHLVTQALIATAALQSVPAVAFDAAPVVAIGKHAEMVAVFARRVVPGEVIATVDARDAQMRQALSVAHGSGRPAVAVSADNLRAAVRLTRRGGYACGPSDSAQLPSVADVVQREVTITQGASIGPLLSALTSEDWADALEAVSALQSY